MATSISTASGDSLNGTAAADSIQGDATTSMAWAGDDTLVADAGNDILVAGDGTDPMAGSGRDDTLFGGDGDDRLDAGSGQDAAFGGLGNDAIDGGAGDDFLDGGDGADSVDGGGGADTLLGGTGDDVLHGDGPAPAIGDTETLSWVTSKQPAGSDVSGGFTQDTGGMAVQVTYTDDGAGTGFTTSDATTYNQEKLSPTSSGVLAGTGAGDTSTLRLDFEPEPGSGLSNEVTGVTFRLNEVDSQAWRDVVTVTAFDANGKAIPVTLTASGKDAVAGDTVTAGDSLDSADSPDGSVLVTIPGPVQSVVIDYGNAGTDGQVAYVSDVRFTTAASPEGADSVAGGDGDDTILGGGGNDSLQGDAGDDSIAGRAGDDTLFGGLGNDSLVGDAGDDALTGGAGSDAQFGGDGADAFLVTEGDGADAIQGGEGGTDADVLRFGSTTSGVTVKFSGAEAGGYAFNGPGQASGTFAQVESVDGSGFNDMLHAGEATSSVTLSGLDGDDSLTGGTGADALFGGAGNDRIAGGAGADSISGGTGQDTVDYSASTAGVTVNLGAGTGSGGHAQGDVLGGIDGVIGSAHADSITGFDGQSDAPGDTWTNVILAGGGNDTVDGRGGNDTLDGGTGNDLLGGGSGDDLLTGGDGNDHLWGSTGNDALHGEGGADTLWVGPGEGVDVLDGGSTGTDADTLDLENGGLGTGSTVTFTSNEGGTFAFGTGTGTFADIERVVTSTGADVVDAQAATGGVNVLTAGGADALTGGSGGDTLDGGDGNDSISGGQGADTALGGAGDDRVSGGAGDDRLDGGADRDTFVQGDGAGADTILGGSTGADLDTLDLSSRSIGATVALTGAEAGSTGGATFSDIERVVLTGQGDTADARPSASSVTFDGGGGDDTLLGGSGADSLGGGAGDDRIALSNGFGADTVAGGEAGEAMGDTLDASAVASGTTVTFTGAEAGTISDGGSTAAFSEIEHLKLGGGADSVVGAAGAQDLSLGGGADTVRGSGGDDRIDLGPDKDRDVVVLADGDGADTVLNFWAPTQNPDGSWTGHDALDVSRLTFASGRPVTVRQVAVTADPSGNAVLAFPGGESLLLQGVPAAGLTPAALNAMGIPLPDGIVDGTSGDDLIDTGYAGDPDGDRIDASDAVLPGAAPQDDSVQAGAGDDRVFAGDGDDRAEGGDGDDSLFGGDGDDSLLGEAGRDVLDGGLGDDRLDGGDGDDVLQGAEGRDTLLGGDGDDTLNGGDDADSLAGGGGNDALSGGGASDALDGGAGDDRLDGGDGDDSLAGGDGRDAVSGGDGDDSLAGGEGVDELDGGTGDDALAGDGGDDTLYGGDGDDSLDGGDGADTLHGAVGDDRMVGGEGDDLLFGEAGSDSVEGGLGADTVYGGLGSDASVGGGVGNDFVSGRYGSDTVFGGAGDDLVHGDLDDSGTGARQFAVFATAASGTGSTAPNGTFTFAGTGGAVTMESVDDDDLFQDLSPDGGSDVDAGAQTLAYGVTVDGVAYPAGTPIHAVSQSRITNATTGETGQAWLIQFGSDPAATAWAFDIPVVPGDQLAWSTGPDATDTTGLSYEELVQADGSTAVGDDTLHGGDGDDTLFGADGDDSLQGDAGHDGLFGGTGRDGLDGGTGDDLLSGGDGDDSLSGGDGNDSLRGEGGDDSLAGGAGNDSLDGGAGADSLAGGIGADALAGGDGADALSGGDGDDVLDGGAGADSLLGEAGRDSLDGGAGADDLDGGDGDDRLEGGADADTLSGGLGDDSLSGGAGDDTVRGGGGGDLLFGGDGDDRLTGGSGRDTFHGGAGRDRIEVAQGDAAFGGDGDDTFTVADLGEAGGGVVTVYGGEGGEVGGDVLELGHLADMGSLVITDSDDAGGGISGYVTLDDGTILFFDEIETVVCFAAGTRIATSRGARAVEDLRVGDLVVTRDHGLQEVRWTGARTVPAQGALAPIRIRPGVVPGLQRDLLVSPQHRMLFQGHRAELLFGESEVLVPAIHLVDGLAVTHEEGGVVAYHHVLFDRHEIIYAEGAATESFHPGEVGLNAVDEAGREELFAIFPELRDRPSAYGQAARRSLKRHEARLLRG